MSDTPIFDDMLLDVPETHAVHELPAEAVLEISNEEIAHSGLEV